MSNNESMEMYLETIYILEQSHGQAHSVDIAKALGVSKPSVTKASKRLMTAGHIKKEPYGSITLTDSGRSIAERVYNNHKVIAAFLEQSLEVDPQVASNNACRIEHVIGEEVIEAMKSYITAGGKNGRYHENR